MVIGDYYRSILLLLKRKLSVKYVCTGVLMVFWLLGAARPAAAILYTGGDGRGADGVLFGSEVVLTMTSDAAQTFDVGDGTTAMSELFVTQEFFSSDGILTANDIRVTIPAALNMVWDVTDTTAVIGGSASGKVSTTVSYEDSDRTLVLDVTSDFIDDDQVSVSGLQFKDFTATGGGHLFLEIDNAGNVVERDFFDKAIYCAIRTTGFIGGNGRGETMSQTAQSPNSLFHFGL